MNSVGLHLRLTNSLEQLAEKALRLQLPFFQCFFLETMHARVIDPSRQEINDFLKRYRPHFSNLYLHGSYWINLAGVRNKGHQALNRELELAQRLEFTHLILHPGSAVGAQRKEEGIDALARSLNTLIKKKTGIKIVLENVAHGGFSIGGDLHDFADLLQKLDEPEQIFFCIDTAHAYSFGYDVTDHAFIDELDSLLGLHKIHMIHLNDTNEKLGSKIDKHAHFGQGLIGYNALKKFAVHPNMVSIPLLLELPIIPEEDEQTILNDVRAWR